MIEFCSEIKTVICRVIHICLSLRSYLSNFILMFLYLARVQSKGVLIFIKLVLLLGKVSHHILILCWTLNNLTNVLKTRQFSVCAQYANIKKSLCLPSKHKTYLIVISNGRVCDSVRLYVKSWI